MKMTKQMKVRIENMHLAGDEECFVVDFLQKCMAKQDPRICRDDKGRAVISYDTEAGERKFKVFKK